MHYNLYTPNRTTIRETITVTIMHHRNEGSSTTTTTTTCHHHHHYHHRHYTLIPLSSAALSSANESARSGAGARGNQAGSLTGLFLRIVPLVCSIPDRLVRPQRDALLREHCLLYRNTKHDSCLVLLVVFP
ncbi:hypothetical protein E2C01_002159 [Portunus trituberculatus]|uniref:Uncharacterized protein n=1 Tax=Portunus trituberculatus TaxID=210409 RepID=A0A5B7CJU4_PORTR|nr:hypothetical protein [Portunus trituberculatus]